MSRHNLQEGAKRRFIISLKRSKRNECTLKRSCIKVGARIGHGSFGVVHEGEVTKLYNEKLEKPRKVAIKMLSQDADVLAYNEFREEAKLMQHFSHENVITVIGAITDTSPMLMVLELMENGDLKSLLMACMEISTGRRPPRNLRGFDSVEDKRTIVPQKLETSDFFLIALQISSGMTYLSERGCVHKDLSARNILVNSENVCKISDFGLCICRCADNGIMDRNTPNDKVAIRWTAPEAALDNLYTSASDVWSFGVLLYEIWSFGSTPYPGVILPDLLRFIVHKNYQMELPKNMPHSVVQIAKKCWHLKPELRPTFWNIRGFFLGLIALDPLSLEKFGYNETEV